MGHTNKPDISANMTNEPMQVDDHNIKWETVGAKTMLSLKSKLYLAKQLSQFGIDHSKFLRLKKEDYDKVKQQQPSLTSFEIICNLLMD